MQDLIKMLDGLNDLVEDKSELRAMGLTEEEVEGYEQFFCEHYFTEIRPWQLCMNMNVNNAKQNKLNGTN